MNTNLMFEKLRQCAEAYRDHFLNRTLLFIGYKPSSRKTFVFEATFLKTNYLHLTGLQYDGFAWKFFDECIAGRISDKNLKNRSDGNIRRKLEALPSMLESGFLNAKMIGASYKTGVMLSTDLLAGNVQACMGFVTRKETAQETYVPNTVLKEDIRKVASNTFRVVAVCGKHMNDDTYSEVVFLAKDVKWSLVKIPQEVKALVQASFDR